MIITCECDQNLKIKNPPEKKIKVICPKCGTEQIIDRREEVPNETFIEVEGYLDFRRELPVYFKDYLPDYLSQNNSTNLSVTIRDYGLKEGYEDIYEKKIKKRDEIRKYHKRKKSWHRIKQIAVSAVILAVGISLGPPGIIISLVGIFIWLNKSAEKYDALTSELKKKMEKHDIDPQILSKYKDYQNGTITPKDKRRKEVQLLFKSYINEELEILNRAKEILFEIDSQKMKVENLQTSFFASSKKDLFKLQPEKFEHFAANYFKEKGFQTELTSYINDGGVDIILHDENGETIYVQCKRFKSSVSSPDMRNFLGTMVHNGINSGYFVTTGSYTQQAIEIASQNNIKLIDGDDLAQIISSEKYQKNKKAIEKDFNKLERLEKKIYSTFFNISKLTNKSIATVIDKKIEEYEKFKNQVNYSTKRNVNTLVKFCKETQKVDFN